MELRNLKESVLIWGALPKEGLALFGGETVIVSEGRPFLYGLKHNAPLLKDNGIPFVYCTDNILGHLFYARKIKKTFFFYKEAVEKGFIGFCGSLYTVLLSRLHNVPVEALPGAKISLDGVDKDASVIGGRKFVLEEGEEWIVLPDDELVNREVLR